MTLTSDIKLSLLSPYFLVYEWKSKREMNEKERERQEQRDRKSFNGKRLSQDNYVIVYQYSGGTKRTGNRAISCQCCMGS